MAELEEPLSERELEVLDLLVKGAANREIADKLFISPNTVKVHLRKIYTKLGVSSRTEAVTTALNQGLAFLPNRPTPSPPEPTPPIEPHSPTEQFEPEPSPLVMPVAVSQPIAPARPAAANRWVWFMVLGSAGLALFVFLTTQLPTWLTANNIPPTAPAAPTSFLPQPMGEDRHWLTGLALPTARAGLVLAAVGLDLYAIGGETADGVSPTLYILPANRPAWEIGPDKPTPVKDAAATVLFGEIYVLGGERADGTRTAQVEVYSPANNAWRAAAALPQPISGALALTDGSFLYLFGGWDGQNYLPHSYLFDPAADTWRPLPSMGEKRAFAAGGYLTGSLYVVGGYNGQNELATCEHLNPNNQTWRTCSPLLMARSGGGAAVIFNQLYLFGGGITEAIPYGETFDPNSETWQLVNMPILPEQARWVHFGLTSIETKLYLVGGRMGDRLQSDTYIYERFPFRAFIPAARTNE